MDTLLIILLIISIIVFIFIYVPILAYYAFKTKKHENHTILKRRQPRLTILLSMLSIAWILSFVFAIFVFTFFETNTAISISNFLIISLYISFTYTLIWRLWFIYFDIIYNASIAHLGWQQLINGEAGANNWYIQEKTMTRWGNPEWVKKLMICLILCNVFVYAIFHFVTFSAIINFVIRLFIIFAPWMLIVKIYEKIPTFRDDIGIAKEIKFVMIAYFIMGVFFICLFITVSVLTRFDNVDAVFAILFHLSYHFVAFSAFFTSMIMTWWPLKKYMVYDDEQMKNYRQTSGVSPSASPNTGRLSVSHTDIDIQQICSSMLGMDLLMKFLEGEYSRENLLFIIEVTLLQRDIYEHIGQNQRQYMNQNIDLTQINMFRLPSTCPKSTIVNAEYESEIERYGKKKSGGKKILHFIEREHLRFKCVLYELFRKYIARGSELCVNVSSMERAKIHRLLGNEEKWMMNAEYNDIAKLLRLFELSKNEAISLITTDSLPRFKRTNSFERIVEMIEKIHKKAREKQIASSPKQSKRDLISDHEESITLE